MGAASILEGQLAGAHIEWGATVSLRGWPFPQVFPWAAQIPI